MVKNSHPSYTINDEYLNSNATLITFSISPDSSMRMNELIIFSNKILRIQGILIALSNTMTDDLELRVLPVLQEYRQTLAYSME